MRVNVRFTQSARRHRIGKAHVRHVINTTAPITVPADATLPGGWSGSAEATAGSSWRSSASS